jgi:hypothetical protein
MWRRSGGDEMLARCAECGTELREGTACHTIFESFMALEFSDPAYAMVGQVGASRQQKRTMRAKPYGSPTPV